MTQRLTIAFADAPGAVQGIAIEGAGAVVASADGVRALPGALLREGPDGAWALSAPGALELAFEPVGGDAPSRLLHARGEIGAHALDGDALLSAAGADPPLREAEKAGGEVALSRALALWLGPETLALVARRPRGARGHGDELIEAVRFEREPPAALAIADARLSTTYDGEGRVVHCGLELWEGEECLELYLWDRLGTVN